MSHDFPHLISRQRRAFLAAAGGAFLTFGADAHAQNLLNSFVNSHHAGANGASATQTTTAATTATTQASQTATVTQNAQASLLTSMHSLQVLQAAQAAARAAAASQTAANLGLNPNVPGQILLNVPNGLALGGLMPLIPGSTAVDPRTLVIPVPVTTNTNGTSSVSLTASTAITLPPSISGSSTITASGSGVVGTVTTGGVITPLTAGVATTIAPGSTVSITAQTGSTVTFGSGSTGIPTSFSTYNYAGTGVASVPSSWSGIGGLTQSTYAATSGQTAVQTTVTVTQTQRQAVLTWQNFNIGKNTTLDFDQSAGGADVSQWVAINEIKDPSLAPSQILGAIQAPGQVYVINQNGIIFGGASQVNVGALTAASLALNPAYITSGLLNDAGNSYQFQFSSLFTTTTTADGTTTVAPLWSAPPAAPVGGSVTVSSVATGDVTVQPGAQLNAFTNAENQGGRIALIAPNVTNNGTISTPDGQTILAAGLQVALSAHNANDASLRGLDVYIGQVSGVSSTLPVGTFTFNGLPSAIPGDDELTFTGSGTVGSYTTADGNTTASLTANTPVVIPTGSSVTLTSGAPTVAAVSAGVVTNGASTVDASGNVLTPGGDIEAARADVMLTGQTVNQLGLINGSTSVTLNGRIDLLADYGSSSLTIGATAGFYPSETGTVNLGAGSVTQILPELTSTDTAIGTTLAVSSLVNIQALTINLAAASGTLSGALIYAPSASEPSSTSSAALDLVGTSLTSGVTLDAGTWFGTSVTTFQNTTGNINLGDGATIDVSGSENVSASVAENIIAVQLRGPELANSPLQQNGALRGDTVYVDIRDTGVYDGTAWIGTPIGDVSGYVNDVQRTVGELTTNGGTVALKAGGSVNMGTCATVNVSGGWINYAGADVATTKVVTNGQILDISQATPNLVYSGLYTGYTSTSLKWGTQQVFTESLLTGSQYEAGYVQGGNGGAVSITAPGVTLSGNLYGNTVQGAFQRTPDATLSATYGSSAFSPTTLAILGVPEASTFNLSFSQAKVGNATNVYQSTSPNVEFETDDAIANDPAPANTVVLSQDIIDSNGFGNLTIDTVASGTIIVPAGVSLTTSSGGQITFTAANIDIEGSIAAPGAGGMTFTVADYSPNDVFQTNTPASDPTRGHFTLGANASLSSSGLVVDDMPTSATAGTLPMATAGGTISIAALDVNLATGSKIDVSGGAAISSSGALTYGSAGSISVLGGEDPNITSVVSGGQLFLGATLTGYSGKAGGGGTLKVQAPLVQIGGSSLLNGDSSTTAFSAGETSVTGNGTTLWLDQGNPAASSDFFSQGGFGNFTIEGIGQIETNGTLPDGTPNYLFSAAGDPLISPAVLITANTHIAPIVQTSIAVANGNSYSLVPVGYAAAAAMLPSGRGAVNLTFSAEGVSSSFALDGPPEPGEQVYSNGNGGGLLVRGDIVMQAGASIQTDPQTNASHGVALQASHGLVEVLGTITAPGGTITIAGGDTAAVKDNSLLFYESSDSQPFPTVDLGPSSILSTAGATELTYNALGLPTGSVLSGGNIAISGNIVAESGAVLNVSGSSAMLDESAATLGFNTSALTVQPLIATTIESSGGSISLNATQLLYSDATLLGSAGGTSAQGGSLTVNAGFADTVGSAAAPNTNTTQSITLIVSQTGLNGGYSLPNGQISFPLDDGQIITGSSLAVGTTVNTNNDGEPVYSYFAANPNLFVSTTSDKTASNNGGQAGGFTSLTLDGSLDFVGPVSITTSNSLVIAKSAGASVGGAGGVIEADALGGLSGSVVLTAPYVALNAYDTSLDPDAGVVYPNAVGGTGSLVVNAGVLADVGNLSLQNISTLTFNATPSVAGAIRGDGTLQVAGQINLNATQIYPPTADTFTIQATGANGTISITAPSTTDLPALPLSAGGTLDLYANTINQGGVLRAPFGVINLGSSTTQSVTLSSSSITSVSAVDPMTGVGITVPYGIVDNNGEWLDPNGNNIDPTGNSSSIGLPAKAVNITSQNVDLAHGSTIDLTGGGDLMAYSFTTGTGGTQDILASTGNTFSSTSFAILPGYTAGYAPDGTYSQLATDLQTNGAQDAGYYNSSLKVGEQIYLNASNGLAAGYYTLLPARYALLPGAYLVTPGGGAAPGTSVSQPDGSSEVSGYVTSGLSTTASPIYGEFQLYSQATVLGKAPYTINLANTVFPTLAASANVSTPRLPVDAGQLVLNATGQMTIEGTLLSQPGAGGLGGEVDISSSEEIYIGPSATAPAGALVLDSSQLTSFGAASLLIGGFRTTTDAGTIVTVETNDIVVDNGGSTTMVDGVSVAGLAAPDITLVSNGTLALDAGATIQQLGELSGNAPTLTLSGDGALLRVSSDASAQINRQATPGVTDTTSTLSIGQGVKIGNANGGAAGSIIFDSTAVVAIDPSTTNVPVLSGTALTFDSSSINLEVGTGTLGTAPTTGLVITQDQLQSLLSSTKSLSFLSYSSIALYGSGQIGDVSVDASGAKTYQEANLSLHADDIYYADTVNSAGITINAQTVSLDNLSGGAVLPHTTGLGTSASLTINAQTITLGSNAMRMDQFSNVNLNADGAVLIKGLGTQVAGTDATPTPSSLSVSGNLTLTTPLITSATAADQSVFESTTAGTAETTVALDEAINAVGAIVLQSPTGDMATSPAPGGLAASLSLNGSSITQNSGSIVLHSGTINLNATGAAGQGQIAVNGTIDASGVGSSYYSLNKYTNGGQVSLTSANDSVTMGSSGLINVSAASGTGTVDSGAGQGGSVTINSGTTIAINQIQGQGSTVTDAGTVIAQGAGGCFSLNAGSLSTTGVGLISSVESGLGGFDQQTIRDRTDTTLDIDTNIKASSFSASADQGSIVVANTIDASNVATANSAGQTILVGGNISLEAGGSVTLMPGSVLTVAGSSLNNAGEGGTVTIEAGAYEGGGALASTMASIDLEGQINLGVNGASGGTLYLRAPQVDNGTYTSPNYTPVAVNEDNGGNPFDVAINPIASGTVVNAGTIVVEGFYVQDALASSGDMVDNYEANAQTNASAFMANAGTIQNRIFGSSTANINIVPGEEIDNSLGALTLESNWDLSPLRYTYTNPAGASVTVPGMLTIRAAGNFLVQFGASLTDGFDSTALDGGGDPEGVSYENPLMPVGDHSWSYNLVAGADFTAASSTQVQSAAQLKKSGLGGSFELGSGNTSAAAPKLTTLSNFFQTIRTGTGNITITAGGNVLLMNELATIYTAGSQVDPTLGGTFAQPNGTDVNENPVPAQYSSGGGNVIVSAQGNIEHVTNTGTKIDTSYQMPTNWLDREGAVSGSDVTTATSWWVDFTNFFEGIGALGGGNVTLAAGGSIVNVDAVVPTNGRVVNGQLTELGGGNLTVTAGTNIDGGVYYVENGQGTISAGGDIQTNSARAAVLVGSAVGPASGWLPTTLYLGTGSFSVEAGGDVLLGPVANPFLLPQSNNNIASDQDITSELSFFSTYGADDAVDVSTVAGTLTLRDFGDSGGQGSLYSWYNNILNSRSNHKELSDTEPWLGLNLQVATVFGAANSLPLGSPQNVFGGVTALMPPTLRATAFSGDLDLVGSLTLSPSAVGTVDLIAGGSVNAFGVNEVLTASFYGSGLVNLSDADPSAVPGILTPISYSGSSTNPASGLNAIDQLFTTTGAAEDLTLQTKENLHADIDGASLHADDSTPAYIFAGTGDISGLTLYSAKQTDVMAGQDITDVGLYIQNNNAADISIVAAGRDIIAYDASSPLRSAAGTNLLGYNSTDEPIGTGPGAPNSGDIQISGPGTLEVLAGRNLTLGNDNGTNPNATTAGDGLNTGLTSIGGQSNPTLPFAGANLVAGAGLGSSLTPGLGNLNFTDNAGTGFIDLFLNPNSAESSTYLPDLGAIMGLADDTNAQVWTAFQQLAPAAQDALATQVFYLTLRDSAIAHNDGTDTTYAEAYSAIDSLFPASTTIQGNIDTTSREIKTSNGGSINLLIPHGGLTVGIEASSGDAVDQGIITVDGGQISIFANNDVSLGTSRIFTLNGGDIVIWSTVGNIAAGASSKTVVSAPPTRVLVDPTSGSVQVDLAGLATGGGIGALHTNLNSPLANIYLIAPIGTVDAGDAGIRASGSLNIAAAHVANADNLSAGGGTSGVAPAASVNLGALSAASSAAGSSQAAASNGTPGQHQNVADNGQDIPSIITVDVLGYGGGDND